jgi:hypothetical protein
MHMLRVNPDGVTVLKVLVQILFFAPAVHLPKLLIYLFLETFWLA